MTPWKNWNKKNSHRTVIFLGEKIESWIELVSVNGNIIKYKIHYLFTNNQEEIISNMEIVYRTKNQLINNLKQSGFEVEKIYGYWDGSNFNEKSPEIIFLAKKV